MPSGERKGGGDEGLWDDAHLPLVDLVTQALGLLPQRVLSLLCSIEILFQLRLEFLTRVPKLCELCFELFVLRFVPCDLVLEGCLSGRRRRRGLGNRHVVGDEAD